MRYGQIAGNKSINATIYHCFEYIDKEDERRFASRFRQLDPDSDQTMHTLRELILGAYLGSAGLRVRHEYVVDEKTPDWSILNPADGSIAAIVELTNFHIDKETEKETEEQLQARGWAVHFRDAHKDNVDRLYKAIWHKVTKYKSLVEDLQVPYVVGLFPEFTAALDSEEVGYCLLNEKDGLFGMYPHLSGVLYFDELAGQYSFGYANNPNALHTIELPVGIFPSERLNPL